MNETRGVSIGEVRTHLDTLLPHACDRFWGWPYAGRAAWFPGIAPIPDVADLLPVNLWRGTWEADSQGAAEVREEIGEEIIAIARFLGQRVGWLDGSSELADWTDDDWADAEASDLPVDDYYRALDVWEQLAAPLRYREGQVIKASVSSQSGALPILSSVPMGLYLRESTIEVTEMRDRAHQAKKNLQGVFAIAAVGWTIALLFLVA